MFLARLQGLFYILFFAFFNTVSTRNRQKCRWTAAVMYCYSDECCLTWLYALLSCSLAAIFCNSMSIAARLFSSSSCKGHNYTRVSK